MAQPAQITLGQAAEAGSDRPPGPEDAAGDAAAPGAATADFSADLMEAAAEELELELREAVAIRDRAALEEAIQNAEGVHGVDPFTLAGAKAVLEELPHKSLLQQKAEAEEALAAAAAGSSVAALEEAIAAADEAGVSAFRIEEAEAKLPEVEERQEASAELSLAVNDKFPNAVVLEKAIARAEAAGVSEEEVLEAKQKVQDMQQKVGKDELAKEISVAMSSGNRESLRRSIPMGEAAGVSEVLLERATEALVALDVQARIDDASAALEAAVENGEATELREAILEAEAAGVEESQIEAAKKLVPQADLTAAMQGEDIDALEEAIDAARTAKLGMQVIGKANVRLAELKQRVRAREDLAEALEEQDVEMLRDAIKAAEDIGVTPRRIEEAKAVYTELEIALRKEKATKELSDATAGTDRDKLRQAVIEAQATGVESSLVQAGELRLSTLELQALIKGESIEELQVAIAVAVRIGVEHKLVDKAKARVTELEERDEARANLLEAIRLGNIDTLKRAMYTAGMARVENEHIEAAQLVLDKLKKEALLKKVRLELKKATQGSDIEALRGAIEAAQKQKIEEALIAKAQDALAALEWKAYQDEVAQKLLDVRSTRDDLALDEAIEALEAALDEAISAKIDDAKILSAKELLAYWRFSAIIPTGNIQALHDNILASEASGVHGLMVVEALQHAVQDAEADAVDSGYVKLARKMLAMLEERVNREMASLELQNAIRRESVEDLQRAILGGQVAGVAPSEIKAAETRILWLEERSRAGKELSVAMRANDIGLLQWTIVDAEKASVNKPLVRKAKKMLQEMESQALEIEAKKVAAYEHLRDAVLCGGANGIDSVDDAVHQVRSIGLGMHVFSPTRDADRFAKDEDAKSRQKRSLETAWERASATGDLAAMQAVFKDGIKSKMEPWELGLLEQRMRLVATKDLRVAGWGNAKDYANSPFFEDHKGMDNFAAMKQQEPAKRRTSRNSNRRAAEPEEDSEVISDNQQQKKKCSLM